MPGQTVQLEEILAKPDHNDYQIHKAKKKRLRMTASAQIATGGGVSVTSDANTS